MENLLNKVHKFEKINLKNDGILGFPANLEKQVFVPNSKFEETRRSLRPVESRPGMMYGLCRVQKVHKVIISTYFCLQLIKTPIYKLAEFLVLTL